MGKEREYDRYCAVDTVIWRIGGALATLCAGLALFLGYRKAYLADVVLGIAGVGIALLLKEVPGREQTKDRSGKKGQPSAAARVFSCLKESMLFLKENKKAVQTIFQNAGVGAVATLMLFFYRPGCRSRDFPNLPWGRSCFSWGWEGPQARRLW